MVDVHVRVDHAKCTVDPTSTNVVVTYFVKLKCNNCCSR